MESHIDRIRKLMAAVTSLTGLPVLWKEPSGIFGAEALAMCQKIHENDFCMKVKSSSERQEKCRENDRDLVSVKANEVRCPFYHTCHAGVTELIVPLFEEDIYQGALYLGPFRMRNSRNVYDDCATEFANEPRERRKDIEAAKEILTTLTEYVSREKENHHLRTLSQSVNSPKIQEAMKFIRLSYMKNPSASQVARHCDLSVSRLLHLFKEKSGVTFSDFLIKTKIEGAKDWLTSTNFPISRVAFEVGFASQSYFGSVFRKHCALTPREYRMKHKKRQP